MKPKGPLFLGSTIKRYEAAFGFFQKRKEKWIEGKLPRRKVKKDEETPKEFEPSRHTSRVSQGDGQDVLAHQDHPVENLLKDFQAKKGTFGGQFVGIIRLF